MRKLEDRRDRRPGSIRHSAKLAVQFASLLSSAAVSPCPGPPALNTLEGIGYTLVLASSNTLSKFIFVTCCARADGQSDQNTGCVIWRRACTGCREFAWAKSLATREISQRPEGRRGFGRRGVEDGHPPGRNRLRRFRAIRAQLATDKDATDRGAGRTERPGCTKNSRNGLKKACPGVPKMPRQF